MSETGPDGTEFSPGGALLKVVVNGQTYCARWVIHEEVLTAVVGDYCASAPLSGFAKHPETLARALAVQVISANSSQLDTRKPLHRVPTRLRLAAQRILESR